MPTSPSTPFASPAPPDSAFEQRTALRAALPLLSTIVATLVLAVVIIALAAAHAPLVGGVNTALGA